MKNIHVLSTDKRSRLYLNTKEYIFDNEYSLSTDECQNKHIYITSDEEIKDGDYYLYLKNNSIQQFLKKHHTKLLSLDIQKKIILTTDQDLAKDGVHFIDYGFLEWFVKNPSCEYVELKGYAIILPGESCDCDTICDECREKAVVDVLTMGQIPANEETREYDLLQHIKFCLECKNESQAIRLIEKYGFQKQEQMYNEEDMKKAIKFGADGMYGWQMGEEGYTDNQIKRFLETFKNK